MTQHNETWDLGTERRAVSGRGQEGPPFPSPTFVREIRGPWRSEATPHSAPDPWANQQRHLRVTEISAGTCQGSGGERVRVSSLPIQLVCGEKRKRERMFADNLREKAK